MALTTDALRQYAERGAAVRLQELHAEIAALKAAFPGLAAPAAHNGRERTRPHPRTRASLSPTQRAAISKRMRAYWAARRKAAKPTR